VPVFTIVVESIKRQIGYDLFHSFLLLTRYSSLITNWFVCPNRNSQLHRRVMHPHLTNALKRSHSKTLLIELSCRHFVPFLHPTWILLQQPSSSTEMAIYFLWFVQVWIWIMNLCSKYPSRWWRRIRKRLDLQLCIIWLPAKLLQTNTWLLHPKILCRIEMNFSSMLWRMEKSPKSSMFLQNLLWTFLWLMIFCKINFTCETENEWFGALQKITDKHVCWRFFN